MAPKDANGRALIIGIDGGTWRVLTPAIELGHMPFLRYLINGGASGTLFSTIPALTPPAWAIQRFLKHFHDFVTNIGGR